MIKERGVTLVEIVVGSAIVSVVLLAMVGTFNLYLQVVLKSAQSAKASLLAEEGLEAVKYLKKISWGTNVAPLTLDTPYYLTFASNTWTIGGGSVLVDSLYTRTVTLSAVSRDATSNIVSSGGTLDVNSKKLTATVTWPDHGVVKTKTLSTYIDNLYDN